MLNSTNLKVTLTKNTKIQMMKICTGANDNGVSYKIATMKTAKVCQMEDPIVHAGKGVGWTKTGMK